MSSNKKNKSYPKEFKEEAVTLVTEQGYSVPEGVKSLGVAVSLLYNWKARFEKEPS
jgi:transposase